MLYFFCLQYLARRVLQYVKMVIGFKGFVFYHQEIPWTLGNPICTNLIPAIYKHLIQIVTITALILLLKNELCMRTYKNRQERNLSNDDHDGKKYKVSHVEYNSASPSSRTTNVFHFFPATTKPPLLSGHSCHTTATRTTSNSSTTETRSRPRMSTTRRRTVSPSSSCSKQASHPIPCPIPANTLEECEVERGLVEIYNQATWNMYHR